MKLHYGVSLLLAGLLSGAALADSGADAKSEFYVNPGIALTGAGAGGYKNSFSLEAGYLKAIHPIASIGWEVGYLFGSKLDNTDTSLKVLHVAPEIKVGPTSRSPGFNSTRSCWAAGDSTGATRTAER
jgi:hypothetical protein